LSRGPLPGLNGLFDKRSGQCVGEVGGESSVTRIADDLEDTAVPHGHYPNVLAQSAQKGGGRLKFRTPFQVKFAGDSFDQSVLLKQFRLSLHVQTRIRTKCRSRIDIAEIEKVFVECLNFE
jgi:hypothetical protein